LYVSLSAILKPYEFFLKIRLSKNFKIAVLLFTVYEFFYIRYYFLAYGDPALTCAVTSSVVYWARDGDQLFIYVREKGMGLIFRIVWFDDMNVLLKSYRFGRTSGDISHCPLARCKK
jgi:hypothetical protein